MMESVGFFLKKEREANNISLREVARITKITAIYLEHIEKNEFDKIPQGPYIKGYLSSYSRAIGCDVDHIIRLYETANHQRPQGGADRPATPPNDAGQVPANPFQTPTQARTSRLAWGNLRSGFNRLLSVATVVGGAVKPAPKPIGTSETPPPNVRKPFRYRAGRVKQPGFSTVLYGWATGRRNWVYACMALFGAVTLFLAAAGFYHLFLFDPGPAVVAETETAPERGNPPVPGVPSRSTTATSPPVQAPGAAPPPPDQPTKEALSAAAAGPVLVGAQSESDAAVAGSGTATRIGAASSTGSDTTRQAALLRHRGESSDKGPAGHQPPPSDAAPKPTITDASVRVLKATICRAIENRMPSGVDQSFTASDEKIYVWSMIASKQVPSTIHHVYYFEGKKISDVSLDVRSARWRTWSSKRIANRNYRGRWHVDIATSNGDLLRRLYFEIK